MFFSLGKRADVSAQDAAEQAKLLKMVLLNCKVDDLNVYSEHIMPFNLIARRLNTASAFVKAFLHLLAG